MLEIKHASASAERARLIAQSAEEVETADELEVIREMLDDLVKEKV